MGDLGEKLHLRGNDPHTMNRNDKQYNKYTHFYKNDYSSGLFEVVLEIFQDYIFTKFEVTMIERYAFYIISHKTAVQIVYCYV